MTIAAFHESLLDHRRDVDTEVTAAAFISRGRNSTGALALTRGQLKLAVGPGKRLDRLPLISCLMPTKNRFEQVKLAIASYRAQTWPNKELIVIDQNLDGALASWIAALGDPTIRVFSMPGIQEPLGALRNRSIDLASGALICAWDDDDLQHPMRLEIGFAALAATKVAACFLLREVVWTPAQRRVGLRQARPYCNTVLAVRAAGLRCPPLPRSEDVPAIQDLLTRHAAVIVDLPELYLYVVHGNYISRTDFLETVWTTATDRGEGVEADSTLAQLARVYPIADYSALVEGRKTATVVQ